MNKNYMMYPSNEMSTTFSDMKQYNNPALPQYVMSMSTNINLGIIDDNMKQQLRMNPNMNSISIKKAIATRGNIRKKQKAKKTMVGGGVKDYMKRFQDSQTFSRINREQVQESINNMAMYSSNRDEMEPYEYKAIDSQIGSLMKRDYTVDRSQMRNQQNLASVVLPSGRIDSTISPNPRMPRLNDSLMFKSTNSPNAVHGMMFNHNTISGVDPLPKRNIASPSRDSRNIKLEPLPPSTIKNNKAKVVELNSPVDPSLEEKKTPKIKHKVVRQETEMINNILDKTQESEKRSTVISNHETNDKKTDASNRKVSVEKRLSSKNKSSKADEYTNDNESPNPMRDNTPSQLTTKSQKKEEEEKIDNEQKVDEKPFKIKFPMSTEDMLTHLAKYLTDYEKTEVPNFEIVYFNALERKLLRGPIVPEGKHNHGYDNEQGEYLYADHDHIQYRFEIIRKLGKGSFGVVLK